MSIEEQTAANQILEQILNELDNENDIVPHSLLHKELQVLRKHKEEVKNLLVKDQHESRDIKPNDDWKLCVQNFENIVKSTGLFDLKIIVEDDDWGQRLLVENYEIQPCYCPILTYNNENNHFESSYLNKGFAIYKWVNTNIEKNEDPYKQNAFAIEYVPDIFSAAQQTVHHIIKDRTQDVITTIELQRESSVESDFENEIDEDSFRMSM